MNCNHDNKKYYWGQIDGIDVPFLFGIPRKDKEYHNIRRMQRLLPKNIQHKIL